MAQEIGALKYFECSSLRHEGTKEIFESILGMILEASPKLRKRYNSGKWRRKSISMLQPGSAFWSQRVSANQVGSWDRV
jgi:hypothetical protein